MKRKIPDPGEFNEVIRILKKVTRNHPENNEPLWIWELQIELFASIEFKSGKEVTKSGRETEMSDIEFVFWHPQIEINEEMVIERSITNKFFDILKVDIDSTKSLITIIARKRGSSIEY